jgi:hypothetical protein
MASEAKAARDVAFRLNGEEVRATVDAFMTVFDPLLPNWGWQAYEAPGMA